MSKGLFLNKISLRNNDFQILNDISFHLNPGHLTAIIGPNGAGKSSLLKTISGECKSFTGDILWNSISWKVATDKSLSTSRATLRQNFNMTFSFGVQEILEMGRYPHSTNTQHNTKIINEVVEFLDLNSLLHKKYATLSGGEQQRVQLGRVFVQIWDAPQEALLLLDEPVSALDIRFQHQLLHLLQELAKNRKWIIIAVLHDLNQVMQYVDEVLLLKKGQLIAKGSPLDVMTPENLMESYNINASWIKHDEYELPTIKIQYK